MADVTVNEETSYVVTLRLDRKEVLDVVNDLADAFQRASSDEQDMKVLRKLRNALNGAL
jgi:hypothetical protein